MGNPWESLEHAARDYVSLLLDEPPNVWGQHVHRLHGRSDYMLFKIGRIYGHKETEAAIDAEFARRIKQKKEASNG